MLTQATHQTQHSTDAQVSDRWDISAGHTSHTSNKAQLTPKYGASQRNTSNSTNKHSHHKMGHLIGAAKRWDISAAYCATHLTAQTNTAYHKMGHLIGAAKRWDISAAYCAHTSNTSNSTNKHSLSQDGSSDMSRQKMGHLSSTLCSHKQHI